MFMYVCVCAYICATFFVLRLSALNSCHASYTEVAVLILKLHPILRVYCIYTSAINNNTAIVSLHWKWFDIVALLCNLH